MHYIYKKSKIHKIIAQDTESWKFVSVFSKNTAGCQNQQYVAYYGMLRDHEHFHYISYKNFDKYQTRHEMKLNKIE